MNEPADEAPGRADSWSAIDAEPRAGEAAAKLARLAVAPGEIEARRRALDLLALRPGEIVVDVGAGTGQMAVEMAGRVAPGGRVFAVDPAPLLLDRARETARAAGVGHVVDCRVADGRDMPFGPAAFDAAFAHWVLLHVDRPEAVVAEMRRVTRRGGRIMAVEIDWETIAVHPGGRDLTRRILHHSADRHLDAWMGRRLVDLFRRAGLRDIVVEPVVDVDTGEGDRAWLDFLHERAAIARSANVIDAADAGAWVAALDAAFADGSFFFSLTQFAVLARIPG
jgi:SAM-dependent methyltransferase